MPLRSIGAFAEMHFQAFLDTGTTNDGPNLTVMDLVLGLRSQPIRLLMVEAGVVVPVAGRAFEDSKSSVGLGVRIAATPDLF